MSHSRCVDAEGNKLRGSMGPSASVHCSPSPLPARTGARSLSSCSRALCAGICEYGYKSGVDGCPTCECDDPCAGYPCKESEECVRVKDADCAGDFCTGYPVCKCRYIYPNDLNYASWPHFLLFKSDSKFSSRFETVVKTMVMSFERDFFKI